MKTKKFMQASSFAIAVSTFLPILTGASTSNVKIQLLDTTSTNSTPARVNVNNQFTTWTGLSDPLASVFDLTKTPENVNVGDKGNLGVQLRPIFIQNGDFSKTYNPAGSYYYTVMSGSDVLKVNNSGNFQALKTGKAIIAVQFHLSSTLLSQIEKESGLKQDNPAPATFVKPVNGVFEVTVNLNPLYRLYNPNSGEHFYTLSSYERDSLAALGWHYEGISGNTAPKNTMPVYRVYNPNAGDHHYTTGLAEVQHLVSLGWRDEGVAFYSTGGSGLPIYRLYNPNAVTGTHVYTSSTYERDSLVAKGWRSEGIAWYEES